MITYLTGFIPQTPPDTKTISLQHTAYTHLLRKNHTQKANFTQKRYPSCSTPSLSCSWLVTLLDGFAQLKYTYRKTYAGDDGLQAQ